MHVPQKKRSNADKRVRMNAVRARKPKLADVLTREPDALDSEFFNIKVKTESKLALRRDENDDEINSFNFTILSLGNNL